MRFLSILFLLSALLLFTAGAAYTQTGGVPSTETPVPGTETGASDDEDLMPLGIGSLWVYKTSVSMEGMSMPVQSTFDTITVKAQVIRAEGAWFGYHDEDEELASYEFFRNAPEGLWRLVFDNKHRNGAVELAMKYPLEVGYQRTSEIDSMSVALESMSETVSVPAGTFEGCYLFRMSFPDGMSGLVWVKPGVGQVQFELEGLQDEEKVRVTRSLAFYKLK